MPIEIPFDDAREDLARLCDAAGEGGETIIIRRTGSEDVALVAAGELSSLIETVHLLRSAKNAERLFSTLERARGRTAE